MTSAMSISTPRATSSSSFSSPHLPFFDEEEFKLPCSQMSGGPKKNEVTWNYEEASPQAARARQRRQRRQAAEENQSPVPVVGTASKPRGHRLKMAKSRPPPPAPAPPPKVEPPRVPDPKPMDPSEEDMFGDSINDSTLVAASQVAEARVDTSEEASDPFGGEEDAAFDDLLSQIDVDNLGSGSVGVARTELRNPASASSSGVFKRHNSADAIAPLCTPPPQPPPPPPQRSRAAFPRVATSPDSVRPGGLPGGRPLPRTASRYTAKEIELKKEKALQLRRQKKTGKAA